MNIGGTRGKATMSFTSIDNQIGGVFAMRQHIGNAAPLVVWRTLFQDKRNGAFYSSKDNPSLCARP